MDFLTRKIYAISGKFIFLVKMAEKVRNLKISKTPNTDTNRILLIPFKVMYISLRYVHSLKNNPTVCRSDFLYEVNQTFS